MHNFPAGWRRKLRNAKPRVRSVLREVSVWGFPAQWRRKLRNAKPRMRCMCRELSKYEGSQHSGAASSTMRSLECDACGTTSPSVRFSSTLVPPASQCEPSNAMCATRSLPVLGFPAQWHRKLHNAKPLCDSCGTTPPSVRFSSAVAPQASQCEASNAMRAARCFPMRVFLFQHSGAASFAM